jgi:ATP-dependent Clp protease ATP-binding subunit ClpB
LEIEKSALLREENKSNQDRISEIDKNLANLKEQHLTEKNTREEGRKSLITTKEIKQQIQKLQHEATIAEKQTDYNKVAEIKYSQIPTLEKKLHDIENKLTSDNSN